MNSEQYFNEISNEKARRLYEQFEDASYPLCEGCLHTTFLVAFRLINIK